MDWCADDVSSLIIHCVSDTFGPRFNTTEVLSGLTSKEGDRKLLVLLDKVGDDDSQIAGMR